jgi:fermentation-respiration switch protein FrsA (DUF1100 family)
LYSLFRPSVQPYLISWFKYDPAKELAKLRIPVLIIQGTTDIQVRKEDAKILSEANPKAEIKIIKGMNHIFKEAGLDRMKNIETYNQPELQIKQELVEVITDFVIKRKSKHNGIGLPITEEPSHTTVRTDHVYGGSADQEA